MRIMVTGSTGFVGLHTTLALIDAGHEVCLLVRSEDKMRRIFDTYNVTIENFVVGDMSNEGAIHQAMEGCDGVIHAAAMVNVDARDAEKTMRNNVDGAKLVIGSAVDRDMKFIVHVSSVTALFSPGLKVMSEDSPIGNATNAYGKSKVEIENYVRDLQQKGVPIAITYPAVVMGPGDPGKTVAMDTMAFGFNKFFPITSSGAQIIDVRDVADVHVKLFETQKAGRYLVGGHFIGWKEYADMIDHITGQEVSRRRFPPRFMRLLGTIFDYIGGFDFIALEMPLTSETADYATQWPPADNTKLENELDFKFRDLRVTLEDSISWLAEVGNVEPRWAENIPKKSPGYAPF